MRGRGPFRIKGVGGKVAGQVGCPGGNRRIERRRVRRMETPRRRRLRFPRLEKGWRPFRHRRRANPRTIPTRSRRTSPDLAGATHWRARRTRNESPVGTGIAVQTFGDIDRKEHAFGNAEFATQGPIGGMGTTMAIEGRRGNSQGKLGSRGRQVQWCFFHRKLQLFRIRHRQRGIGRKYEITVDPSVAASRPTPIPNRRSAATMSPRRRNSPRGGETTALSPSKPICLRTKKLRT